MKITQLDKKILSELDKDGRASYSKIARNTGTTAQVIKYRFERLEELGVIKNFWAFADYDKAGYSFFWAYWIKFRGLSKKEKKDIFSYFENNQNMPIVLRVDGYADMMICITTKSVFEHNKILQNFFKGFGQFIIMSDMVVGLGFESFPRSYLLKKDNEKKNIFISGGTEKEIKMSGIDRKVLSLLQEDGRMEFTEMAKILKVSVGLVHASYKKMKEKGIINKISFNPNHSVLGYSMYRIIFKIVQFDQKRVEEFHDFCILNKNITSYIPVMGNWQLMIDIEIKNRKSLRNLIRKIRYQFKDIIFQTEISEVYKIDKFTQMVIEYPELLKKYKNSLKNNN